MPNDLVTLDSQTLAEMTGVAFEYYAEPVTGTDMSLRILPRLEDIFRTHLHGPMVLAHRDYHADNLIWLPERDGPARVEQLYFIGRKRAAAGS